MSDNGYMIWFVATAALIIAVLTIGTLAAAGLIGRDKSPTRLETEPTDADPDLHDARAYSNAGRQR